MTEKIVIKKSFIGGRLVYPGERVDVDAKGQVAPAASTPLGALTLDQLRAALSAREGDEPAPAPVFGDNLADPIDTNTGAQPLRMAPVTVAGAGATRPQGVPPGSEEAGGRFLAPASDAAPAAVETVVADAALPDSGTLTRPKRSGAK